MINDFGVIAGIIQKELLWQELNNELIGCKVDNQATRVSKDRLYV